jgi:hypothetical protein
MKKLTVAEARQIDMVDYLASLGYHPLKIRGNDYWYLSPFRDERTASFKIKRGSNIWYDHGSGDGGNIIDFGILYHRLDVRGLLELLAKDYKQKDFSFQPQANSQIVGTNPVIPASNPDESKIMVIATRELSDPRLIHYLSSRAVSVELAQQHTLEVDFQLYKKKHTAIGFLNQTGGYELRNAYFKGSSSPKTFRLIDNGSKAVQVFEGFFDFLSWLTLFQENQSAGTNFLILNSLSFFQRARPVMKSHNNIHLWLDRGTAGEVCTKAALKSHPAYEDKSSVYKDFGDLNDYLIHLKGQQALNKTIEQTKTTTIKNKHHGRI